MRWFILNIYDDKKDVDNNLFLLLTSIHFLTLPWVQPMSDSSARGKNLKLNAGSSVSRKKLVSFNISSS
jgi:hypothetical protein